MIGEQYAIPVRRRGERAGARARARAREVERAQAPYPGTASSVDASFVAPIAATAQGRRVPRSRRGLFSPVGVLQDLGQSVLVRLLLAMSFVALAGLLYLLQASQASVLEVNISDLQASHAQLAAENASLRITATSLQSLPRIDDVATHRLHMLKPDLSSAIWISPVLPQVGVRQADGSLSTTDSPATPIWLTQMSSAQHRSQPLGWMKRLLTLIRSSL